MKKTKIRFYVFTVLAIGVMVLIFYLSSQSAASSSKLSKEFYEQMKGSGTTVLTPMITIKKPEPTEVNPREAVVLSVRKWAHVYLYALLGIFVSLAAREMYSMKGRKNPIFVWITSLAVCFLYACSDEFHQTFVDGRGGKFTDVFIDFIGFGITSTLIFIIFTAVRLLQRRKHND